MAAETPLRFLVDRSRGTAIMECHEAVRTPEQLRAEEGGFDIGGEMDVEWVAASYDLIVTPIFKWGDSVKLRGHVYLVFEDLTDTLLQVSYDEFSTAYKEVLPSLHTSPFHRFN